MTTTSPLLRRGLIAIGVLVGAWLIVPTIIVIPVSFSGQDSFAFPPESWSLQHYIAFFTESNWVSTLLISLQVGVAAMMLSVILGTAASLGLAKSRFKGKKLLNGLFMAPLIVPGIVIAVATYIAFLQWGLVGTFAGYILIHTVIALPFVVTNVSSALATFDKNLERASASLGASPWATFWRITFPVIRPAVLSGAVFAFVISFDEVVVSLFIQSPVIQTLPVRMYISVANEVDPTLSAASTIVLLISAPLLLLANLKKGQKKNA